MHEHVISLKIEKLSNELIKKIYVAISNKQKIGSYDRNCSII